MRFLDTMIFIKWGQATAAEAVQDEEISLCGFVLSKVRNGEEALVSSLVKDEALVWFSRYKAPRLVDFIRSLTALTNLRIVQPTLEDELEATRIHGQYTLGISDIINLSIMRRHGVNEIYSTDKGFDQVPSVKRVFDELKSEVQYKDFIKELKLASRLA